LAAFAVHAQPVEQFVKVVVAPDHADWIYKTGEPVKFSIAVLKDGNLLKNAIVKYEVGPEKMEAQKKDSLQLNDGKLTVDAQGMKTPGFLRCTVSAFVDGKEYKYWSTAAFDPLKIEPTVDDPSDFNSFWDSAKSALSKIPIDSRMTLIPEKCTRHCQCLSCKFSEYKQLTCLWYSLPFLKNRKVSGDIKSSGSWYPAIQWRYQKCLQRSYHPRNWHPWHSGEHAHRCLQ
jgi:hypothetical protein